MNASPQPSPTALPLDFYTRFGELNLEGRLLIYSDQQLAAGNHDGALQALMDLGPGAPWLEAICAERLQQVLQWRYEQSSQPERQLVASAAGPGADAAEPDASALLDRVLTQPSAQVVLHGCTTALLLEGLLQQAVWDAAVWLDPQAIPPEGPLPAEASWLDGISPDRRPAPLRELRLRQADQHLRRQGLQWLPRLRPLTLLDRSELEARQQRSMGRLVMQAQQKQIPNPQDWAQEEPSLSLVLTVDGSDSADAIKRSLTSLAAMRQATRAGACEVLMVHSALKPAQRAALEKAMADPALCDLRLLESPKRAGVALACNQALAAARGAQLLLLRAGVSLSGGVLAALQQALSDPACRAVQPLLLSSDQRIVGLGYGFAQAGQPGQALLHGMASPAQLPACCHLQALQGICWLLRREELLAVGGWDGWFRDGLEDQDLCLRLIERFGGHCQVSTAVKAEAPLELGLEPCHEDREWNRAVFCERWRPELARADLAELARFLGYELVGLLPEGDPPSVSALSSTIGVLAPLPMASKA